MPYKNPEHKRQYDREYRRAHPQKAREAHERLHRKRHARTYEGRCYKCGEPKLSEWYCWDCLNTSQFRAAVRAAEELGLRIDP
jgi:hypothetical protein